MVTISRIHYVLPNRLDLASSVEFSRRLLNASRSEQYILDFQDLTWVEPFGLLYLSSAIRTLAVTHADSRITPMNICNTCDSHTYAAHMGFFQASGINIGNQPGQAKGSDTYLPITRLEVGQINEEARNSYKEIGQVIEEHSSRLAQLLTRRDQGDLVDTLTYSLREIIRNVFEHSESDTFEYCAQYWPTKGRVEIGILDNGVGIRKTLSENPDLQVNNDRDALSLCLMPGVSGKVRRRPRREDYDFWENAGLGLYMTSRLCSDGGSFFICSGTAGLQLTNTGKEYFDTDFQGTILRLVLNTRNLVALSRSLKRYSEEGKEIEKMAVNEQLTARAASQMLYRDFKTGK
jgi:hypothetical protein